MSLPASQKTCGELISDAVLDDDAAVRLAAIRLLGVARPKGWEELLLATLEDEDEEIRDAAASAVCQPPRVFLPQFIDPLKKVLPSLKNQLTINRVNNYLRQFDRPSGQETRRTPVQPRTPIPPRPIRPVPNRPKPLPAP